LRQLYPVALDKIRSIRAKFPELDIAVDGGINAETAVLVKEAGANILVAGSYIFGAEDRAKAILSLRS
jgi:ribulose-phosphate 3-epimerase